MWIYKYNDQLIYVPGEEKLINEHEKIPEGFTDVPPPVESYIAKFNPKEKKWEETATQEYIDSLKTKPLPNDLEILKEQNAFLTKQMTQILHDIKELKSL
ncbi:hypothetical protein [Bacillus sp. AM 13(2015)]|uniref:hypothetical protein n=1 Tax=Bacillus sp. AM 13(2015) TaxID=1739115 RepID=UPI00075177E0|nr:hypothetical protein [Bacillus sp. AM 13(2015)]KUR60958.1 hypothetical protein AOQ70_03600 [Bacillus sp. AM 13(2015)]